MLCGQLMSLSTARVAKVMFSQASVCSTRGRGGGWTTPKVNHLPPGQGQRSTTSPPRPGSEVNHLPPGQGQMSTPPPPKHPGPMHRWAVCILECILVLGKKFLLRLPSIYFPFWVFFHFTRFQMKSCQIVY